MNSQSKKMELHGKKLNNFCKKNRTGKTVMYLTFLPAHKLR